MANTRRTIKSQDDIPVNTVVESAKVESVAENDYDSYTQSIWKDIDANTKYLHIPGGIVLNYNGHIEYINGIRYNEDVQRFERI